MNKKAVLADGGKEGELRWQLPARLSRQRLRRFFRITFKATPNQKKLTFKSRNAVLTLTVFKLCFSKNVFVSFLLKYHLTFFSNSKMTEK